jgi:hypothetical protein
MTDHPFKSRATARPVSWGAIALAFAFAVLHPGAASAAASVCLQSYRIDHTEIPDDHTILFYMHNHKVFKNTLVGDCVGLKVNTRGFTYEPTDPGSDEICSNLVTIRLNDTHQVCLLGAFTPVEPTPKDATP